MPSRKNAEQETLAARLKQLLDEHWNGNQAAMARDLEISTASLSLILNGKTKPGRRVLSQIIANGAVNEEWLVSGVGSPISMMPALVEVPIYRTLITSPRASEVRPDGLHRTVVIGSARDLYWFRILSEEMLKNKDENFNDQDLLLIDASVEQRRNFRSVDNRLCVVQRDGFEMFGLARVTVYVSEEERYLNAHFVTKMPSREMPVRRLNRDPFPSVIVNLADVLGVCLRLERALP